MLMQIAVDIKVIVHLYRRTTKINKGPKQDYVMESCED